jgi:pimeloyl-ACP methyl ester carboxylesterase
MHALSRPGREPAVIFIHGFCQSSAYWAPTFDLVAKQGIRCYAPDLPGFGGSAKENGPFTMPALADAVAAQLSAWGLGQVILAGASMGGVVAQHLVLRHPVRVQRLLLVATGAVTANETAALEKADVMAAAKWNEEIVTPVVDAFFHTKPPPEKIAEYRKIALSASQPAAIAAMRSNAVNRTLDQIGAIKVPTLIVQGRYDRARTPEHGAEMRKRIAGSRLEVIEEAGHTPQLEQPDAFHAVALPFLLGKS